MTSRKEASSLDQDRDPNSYIPTDPTNHDKTTAVALVSMRLHVDNTLNPRIAGRDSIELISMIEEVPRYVAAFHSARRRIARAAKLPAHSLPIVLWIDGGEIVISIVTPPSKNPSSILKMSKTVCTSIAKQWRTTSQSTTIDKSPNNLPASLSSEFCIGHEVTDTDQPTPLDPLARTLLDALLGRRQTSNLSLNFAAGGEPDEHPPVIVPPRSPHSSARITLDKPRSIVAQICNRSGIAVCIVREPGSTRQKKATFSTSSAIGTLINMLINCPPVQLEIRDFVSDQPLAHPPHDFVIDRILGLTEGWWTEPFVLDFLESCLNEIRSLMPPELQRPRD